MSRTWRSILFVSIALWMTACSSSPTMDEEGEDMAAYGDAGTDSVPEESAEYPGAPPSDTAAADTPPGDIPLGDTPPGDTPPSEETAATSPGDTPPPSFDTPPPVVDPVVTAGTETAPAEKFAEKAPEPPTFTDTAATAAVGSDTDSKATPEIPAGGSGISTHRIRRGDTLMKIAFRVYGDLFKWKEIYEANKDKISDPNSLPVGVDLNIQDATPVKVVARGEKYMIRQGDTLGSISQDVYGTPAKWKKIWKNNKQLIQDPNRIFAGFYIYYTMSDQDREELEQYQGSTPLAENAAPAPEVNPAPATLGNAASRMPASMPSMPQAPATPTALNLAAPPVPNAVAVPGGN